MLARHPWSHIGGLPVTWAPWGEGGALAGSEALGWVRAVWQGGGQASDLPPPHPWQVLLALSAHVGAHSLVATAAAAAAKSLQSCPTLCDPIDSPPGSPSLGFSKRRTHSRELRAFFSCMAWRAIPGPLSKRTGGLQSVGLQKESARDRYTPRLANAVHRR